MVERQEQVMEMQMVTTEVVEVVDWVFNSVEQQLSIMEQSLLDMVVVEEVVIEK